MKESIKAELLKIAGIKGIKKKIEYIWQYYYLWILGIIALVFFTNFAIQRYFFHVNDNWIYVIFNNTYADVGNDSDLWDGFVEYSGYDLSEKNVEFNNTSFFDYKDGVTGNSYFEAFVAYTEAGTLDAITMEADSLVALGNSGRLMDLNGEACAGIKAKYEDRFLYCESSDQESSTETVPIGIDISDSILMKDYHMYADSCALGIGAYSNDVEAVEAFLDYVLKED